MSLLNAIMAIGTTLTGSAIGIHFVKKVRSQKMTLKQVVLPIALISLITWPVCFFTAQFLAAADGPTIHILEMGIFKYSLMMLAFTLFFPATEYLVERYL